MAVKPNRKRSAFPQADIQGVRAILGVDMPLVGRELQGRPGRARAAARRARRHAVLAALWAKATHCVNGHRFTAKNPRRGSFGQFCKACSPK